MLVAPFTSVSYLSCIDFIISRNTHVICNAPWEATFKTSESFFSSSIKNQFTNSEDWTFFSQIQKFFLVRVDYLTEGLTLSIAR